MHMLIGYRRHERPGRLVASAVAAAVAAIVCMPRGGVRASDEAPDPASRAFYAKRVSEILGKNCLGCHDETAKGGLRLDSYAAIRKGGADGAVIAPGDPDRSMLIQAVRRTGDLKMPPRGALDPTE